MQVVLLQQLTLTTSGTNNETLNIAATFANAVPNASPVAVSYTKDTTPALKFADVAEVATVAVATTSKTASSIALAGGGSSTPAESGTSMASVTKVDATHIDVKFSGNLTPSSSSIEAGDFTVTGNTVTGAAYKNNAADTVTLTLGSALATSGTVSVGYDGASGDASKKLKFEGSFTNQTQAAGPAANPSSGTTAMSLDVAPSDGLKVVGNKVEAKFSGPLTNLDVGNAQELADFEVYYRDPGADSNLFTADDTIEAAIPTAVAPKGSDSIEMTFSSGDAAKITDNTLAGFEFFGNNGSVTNGSNQLTIGGSAKDVALDVRGDMSGDIVGVGPVIQAPNTGPITVDIKFPTDITSTTFDKTKYTVKTGYDYGKLDNAVGTNPGDPSIATVDSVAKHSTDASKLSLTLSSGVADKDYATVTVTDTVALASYKNKFIHQVLMFPQLVRI